MVAWTQRLVFAKVVQWVEHVWNDHSATTLFSYAPGLSPGTDEESEAQTIKWNLSFTGKWTNGLDVLFLCEAARTNSTHIEFLPKTRKPNLIMSNVTWSQIEGWFYQTTGLSFKNVIVMKDEERLGNCFKLKETKVIWPLKAKSDLQLDPRS